MRVVGYIRVSSKGQMDGDGPERQEAAIRAFHPHVLEIARLFVEPVSGTTDGIDRPELTALFKFCSDMRTAGTPITAVVLERMDRLARDLIVSEALIAEFSKEHLQVFSADLGTLTDLAEQSQDPMRIAIRQIMGVLAQLDKSMLVSKLRKARERKAKETGRRCGGELAWTDKHPHIEVNMVEIARRHAEGESYQQLADSIPGGPTRQTVRHLIKAHNLKQGLILGENPKQSSLAVAQSPTVDPFAGTKSLTDCNSEMRRNEATPADQGNL